MAGVIVLLVIINGLYFVFQFWIMKLIGGFEQMEYRNNYVTDKQSVMFNIAIYIRRRFSYRFGTVLLNVFC